MHIMKMRKSPGVSPRIKDVIRNNNRIIDVRVPTTTR